MRLLTNQFPFQLLRAIITMGLIILLAQIGGCVSVPDAPQIIKESQDQTVEVTANNKVLVDNKAETIIENAADGQEANEDLLKRHILVEQGISDTPLVAGNNVRLLFDGNQTFEAMYDAINSAKHHVNLEYFIVENIQFKNADLQTLLIIKARQGVQISIIYDAFGSSDTPATFFEALKTNGIHLQEFHPLDIEHLHNINERDHRKMLIVDGRMAILGGINLSATYQSKSSFGMRLKSSSDLKNAHWRDTDVLIEGPAVAEVQKLFTHHWHYIKPEINKALKTTDNTDDHNVRTNSETYQTSLDNMVEQQVEAIKLEAVKQAEIKNANIDQATFFPQLNNKGNELVRVIGSAPSKGKPLYYVTLISAMNHAEQEILLNSGYFVPTADQKQQLIDAARRGVKVSLLLPGISDSSVAIMVQHSYYDDLLENGVQIHESTENVLHAKTVSIDGVWSVIGSSNFDVRSAATNNEVDIVVLGNETAKELKMKFIQDVSKAKKIELNTWRKRSLITKLKEKFYRIFQNYL